MAKATKKKNVALPKGETDKGGGGIGGGKKKKKKRPHNMEKQTGHRIKNPEAKL